MIYGHDLVLVDKQREHLRWLVSSLQGAQIIAVPWRLVFDQNEIVVSPRARGRNKYDQDKLLALETCLLCCPLDDEDLREINRKLPMLSTKRPWVPDRRAMEWLPTPPRSPRPPRQPESAAEPIQADSDSNESSVRSMSETTISDPERILF